ncbi:hypothetical protein GYMLUDRAFT_412145 [Collybiopsis luxurians FD-317 M1]|nr:hypothetical protein GYMLUDRAFT_412145 [Collybiopsis luxurians FD-317 M1]
MRSSILIYLITMCYDILHMTFFRSSTALKFIGKAIDFGFRSCSASPQECWCTNLHLVAWVFVSGMQLHLYRGFGFTLTFFGALPFPLGDSMNTCSSSCMSEAGKNSSC